MGGAGSGLGIARISRRGSDLGFTADAGVERGEQRWILAMVSAARLRLTIALYSRRRTQICSAQGPVRPRSLIGAFAS